MATRRRWPFVVLGIAILLIVVAIGAIVATVAWFQENMDVQSTSPGEARTAFEGVRERFAGREPLLEIHDGVPRYTTAAEGVRSGAAASLTTLNVLVWDPDDEQLTRIALPFWLLRIKSDPIRLGAYASGLDEGGVSLRPEDIEKYGPGVVLDTGAASGERVLVWAQ